MAEYFDIRIADYEGKCLKSVLPRKLEAVLAKKPPYTGWEMIRRVRSHGTSTLRFKDDLGEGTQDYFIKIIDQSEIFATAWEKFLSAKGLARPWRYPKEMFKHLFDRSGPRVGFEKSLALESAGLCTAEVVAYLTRGNWFFQGGVLITRQIPGLVAPDLAKYLLMRRDQAPAPEFMAEKRALIKLLAEMLAKLMKLDFFLPDLRISNVMVQKTASGEFKLWLIDLVEAQECRPDESRALWHLIADPRNAALFTGSDKVRFLRSYLSASGRTGEWPAICSELSPVLESWWKKWRARRAAQERS